MSKPEQKTYLHLLIVIFSLLYLLSMFLPAYHIPFFYLKEFQEIGIFYFGDSPLLYGYESMWLSMLTIFESPIAFLGSLSNFAVITVWLLYLTRASGEIKLIKSFAAVVAMVSVLIWPVALKIGFLSGYYLWALSSIVITFSYAAMKNLKEETEDILLDEKTISEAD
jgi:hypothetical protein